MYRRTFMAASAASLALPSIARAQKATTLKLIPQIDLAILDPHTTTAFITRNHGFMIFDTLYGTDHNFNPTPQMVEGHTIENDGKLWKLKLRDGLAWHDGTPVTARDCVASIRRWAKRDAFGDALMVRTDELSAPDDKTIQFRLKKPFPLLATALGKISSPVCFMMPERLANTDAFTPIKEMTGSGPFKFVASERVPGSLNVYVKNDKYVPRPNGTVDWTSGPKIVNFDRVEWTTINDAGTASAALQNGEHDWWEYCTHDLMPLLKKNAKVKVEVTDPTGSTEMMRPNSLQLPFSNPAIKRALLGAINQSEFMQAIVGDNPDMMGPLGIFCPGTPMASDVGLEPLKGPRDLNKVKADLKAAGYAGEKVVLMVPVDYPQLKALGDVAADMMGKCGMNVDYIVTDWGTMLQRRNKKDPVDQGGWSSFVTGWAGTDHLNPAGHIALRGNGDQASSWPGWCVSTKLEDMRNAWFDAPDLAAQKKICEDMQRQAMQDVPYWPLGLYYQPTAYRSDIVGVNRGFFMGWNVKRA